jgi:hypothetical protein
MSLNIAGLKGKLNSGFQAKNNVTGIQAAKHIKEGIQQYISSCMDPAGGSFAAMPKINMLDIKIGKIFQKQGPLGSSIGAQVAKEIDQTFMTLKTQRQIAITTVPSILETECRRIFDKDPPMGMSFANALSDAINQYTASITITAVIPGSPPVTVTGPPS